ncbi:UPF0301 protein [Fulvitalea axinellae]|uniref:UPF0301 protein n=1 Tax=Fulvitalea axinellae TaxID=1182444 RepID=A0AAU9D363_9BACT|nr:UPF0301 protein [Fulvitalea axinellae]
MGFFEFTNHFSPLKGDLLLAEPMSEDPNFERTVVLLCEHEESGTVGFVLNRPSILDLSDLVRGGAPDDLRVYVGGPVEQNTLHFLHDDTLELAGSVEILPGLYWGRDFEGLMEQLDAKDVSSLGLRFYIGYSGWTEGQLQDELKRNSWVVYRDASAAEVLFSDSEIMWKMLMKKIGGRYKIYANYPRDPRLN